MSRFIVQLTRTAMRALDELSPALRDQITAHLRSLGSSPIGRPPRIKRLRGYSFPLYRVRSGDYRMVYRIDDEVVTVLAVVHRRDLERALRRLGLT